MYSVLAITAATGAATAVDVATNIPVADIGSTGAVGALVWLTVTARNALSDYRAQLAAASKHRDKERVHWGRVESALSKL